MSIDKQFMQRCIDLAKVGFGSVAPNPMVGCVLVYNEKIIGEGFHQKYGGPHAEVNAINSVSDTDSGLLSQSTLYVNLEPCSHYGKTPPCAGLIVSKNIHRVVIGMQDPNPLVAGKGLQLLKEKGISVTTDILKKECRELNRRFLSYFEKERPYIILKWAQTNDGFIAPDDKVRKQISNEISSELLHKWRSEEQAILVGYNTALIDNPELTVRLWKGKSPVRCVVDKQLQLPVTLHLFDKTTPTIVFNFLKDEDQGILQYIKLDFSTNWINQLLQCLHQKKIQSLIVEGGAKTLQMFMDSSLWDEARVFVSSNNWESGIKAPLLNRIPAETITLQDNQLKIFYF